MDKESQRENNLLKNLIVENFRKLRSALYKILPKDCFHKPELTLDTEMFGLSHRLAQSGLLKREDVCFLCTKSFCRWHDQVNRGPFRTMKIRVLTAIFRRDTVADLLERNIPNTNKF